MFMRLFLGECLIALLKKFVRIMFKAAASAITLVCSFKLFCTVNFFSSKLDLNPSIKLLTIENESKDSIEIGYSPASMLEILSKSLTITFIRSD